MMANPAEKRVGEKDEDEKVVKEKVSAMENKYNYLLNFWCNCMIPKGEWSVAERTTLMEYVCNERS